MKQFILLLGLGVSLLTISACSQEQMYPSFKSDDTFVDGAMQTAPNFAQFREIPVPEKSTMDLKKTLVFGTEPLIGRLAFSAPYSQSNLFDFYMQEMPKFGWHEVTVVRSANSFLTFSKDTRIATIQLSSTATGSSDVIMDVSISKSKSKEY